MEQLYRENGKVVYHYLLSLCHDRFLAEDLTQETFLRAHQSLERFDGSCSRSSREAVEEHVKICGECRESLETLRRTALGGDKFEQSELDLMKKVKRHYVRKSLLIVGGMALAMLLFGNLFDLKLWYSENLYYILFPLIALGTYALLLEYPTGTVKSRRKRLGLSGASVLGILYGIILAFIMCRVTGAIEAHPEMYSDSTRMRLGPAIEYQLTGIAIVELLIFVWFVADSLKNGHALDGLHIISLLGAFLNMILRPTLHSMSDPATLWRAVAHMLVIVLLEGLGIVALEVCAGRYWVRRSEN